MLMKFNPDSYEWMSPKEQAEFDRIDKASPEEIRAELRRMGYDPELMTQRILGKLEFYKLTGKWPVAN